MVRPGALRAVWLKKKLRKVTAVQINTWHNQEMRNILSKRWATAAEDQFTQTQLCDGSKSLTRRWTHGEKNWGSSEAERGPEQGAAYKGTSECIVAHKHVTHVCCSIKRVEHLNVSQVGSVWRMTSALTFCIEHNKHQTHMDSLMHKQN